MNNKFEPLNSEDAVLSIENSQERVLIHEPMFKVGKLLKTMKSRVIEIDINSFEKQEDWIKQKKKWLDEGVSCEVMKPGGNWQKGKVRVKVTLEFSPDEPINPPSPLDDLRQKIQETEN
ncbi:KGK domain-containing protein [Microseira wollei]|uniref:KGK family protein n=1 Tax=Microseira wollei NIES-4236 TaxID=2530354 RepID=A0AAV3X5H4_9CYAN|nr:KGK domain-containing protein [Microseira wollei]GET37369.1 hypothetical protein MiSe_21220 [Microseira wollei NIES-4236]